MSISKLSVVVLGVLSLAAAEKRKHGAHDHGVVKLSIAAEKNEVAVDLESPAESIVGFEHDAKKPEHKKQQEEAFAKLKSSILEILGVPAALGCSVTSSEIGIDHEDDDHHKDAKKSDKGHAKEHGHGHEEEGHSDVDAEFKLKCTKAVSGSEWSLNFAKTFPKVKKVKLQINSTGKQEGRDIDAFPAAIKL